MKKQLGFLFIFLLTFILFGSCNNATKEPDTGKAKKPDTVIVKPDSNAVKDIDKRKAGQ
jgi:hypothetical protein